MRRRRFGIRQKRFTDRAAAIRKRRTARRRWGEGFVRAMRPRPSLFVALAGGADAPIVMVA